MTDHCGDDLECTCDIGPFATCPACSAQPIPPAPAVSSALNRKKTHPRDRMSAEDYANLVRAGGHWS
jgi:hypothetical protein